MARCPLRRPRSRSACRDHVKGDDGGTNGDVPIHRQRRSVVRLAAARRSGLARRLLCRQCIPTLIDINRALDRLGIEAFIPHARRLHAIRVAVRSRRMSVRLDPDPSRAFSHRASDVEES